MTDDPRSTQIGSNVRGSVKNLADYTKRKLLHDPSSSKVRINSGFTSSLEGTSNGGQGIDRSLLDKIDVNSDSLVNLNEPSSNNLRDHKDLEH